MSAINITTPAIFTRAWGDEIVVVRTAIHICKILNRQPNTEAASRGFQMHIKEESHYLYEGRMLLETLQGGQVVSQEIFGGMGWTVPPCQFHRETALTACIIIEVSDPTVDDRFRSGADYGGLKSMTDDEAHDKLHAFASALRRRAVECEQLAERVQSAGLKSFLGEGVA